MNAAMMPDTAHQTKAIHPAVFGASLAVDTSTLSKPTPNPSMVSRICRPSEANTPARTADQVQPAKITVVVPVRYAMASLHHVDLACLTALWGFSFRAGTIIQTQASPK